jgi:carboxymethylenebutenolidase
MRTLRPLVLMLMLASALLAEEAPPTTVTFPSGNLQIKAFFWKPAGPGPFPAILFNHGSGGEDAAHTAGLPITDAAEKLAPIFLKHGYAFLYPFRRGQGPSADQAPFMQDVLKREENAKGKAARQHLQFVLLTTEQLDDASAGLKFLKSAPGIDPRRLAVIGHSFGGQLSLLVAERDPSVRAVVTFAGAAGSWEHSPELRDRLLAAVGKIDVPIMLIQAENDYSTAAGHALGDELQRLHKPHVLKIDPGVGDGPEDRHNEVYRGTGQWEGDVFKFLDQNLR